MAKSNQNFISNSDALLTKSKICQSKMGYEFDLYSNHWILDGSVSFTLDFLTIFDEKTRLGLRLTLGRYAEELSASTTQSLITALKQYKSASGETNVNVKGLSKWRSMLSGEEEARMGRIKSFFLAWHEWGFEGIDSEVVKYLESLTLKGIIKGKPVKGACPFTGPFSVQEQGALLEWASGAFEKEQITLTQYSLFLCLILTGRRTVQLRSLRACDLLCDTSSSKPSYELNIPRVKQTGVGFREAFIKLPIPSDLYYVLKNQIDESVKHVENNIGESLPDRVKAQVPIFIQINRLNKHLTIQVFNREINSKPDFFHMSRGVAQEEIRKTSQLNFAYSERTGEIINFTSRRFRYTKGTNLSRRGIGGVTLAHALDHTDTQHISVYTQNTPEVAAIIDESMATALAPLAQAFAGTLIDSERDAIRGNDPHSRVKNEEQDNIGNCGSHGFCSSGFRACYTCVNFQPWKDAPHEEVREIVLEDRKRQQENGVSIFVIESTDRLLLAVEQVIQMCAKSKEVKADE